MRPVSEAAEVLRDQLYYIVPRLGVDQWRRESSFEAIRVSSNERRGRFDLIRRGVELQTLCFTVAEGSWNSRPGSVEAIAVDGAGERRRLDVQRLHRGCFGIQAPAGTQALEIAFEDLAAWRE